MINIIIAILSSKQVINLIAKGVDYLVNHKTSGISRDLALIMIEAIKKSKHNDLKIEVK